MERIKENEILNLALEVLRKNLPIQVEFHELAPLHQILPEWVGSFSVPPRQGLGSHFL